MKKSLRATRFALLGLGAVGIGVAALRYWAPKRRSGSSYRLKERMKGERVPSWLFTGRSYRGAAIAGAPHLVRLFDPDSAFSTVLPRELLVPGAIG